MAAAVPSWLRGLAFVALAVALAGPRQAATVVEDVSEGIDIVIALDLSTSMLAQDFRPYNRLEVARSTTARFVEGRARDRIGLVGFGGEALTRVPLTLDHEIVFGALNSMQAGDLGDGTAIGMGLATAASRLRRQPGTSRVVILMSDGENNRGAIDPRAAARAAAAYGIRVYTIGVGSTGMAPVPVAQARGGGYVYGLLPVKLDELLLRDVAAATGGRYFRATDARALGQVFAEVDRLTRTPARVRRHVRRTERYLPFVLAAAGLLLLEGLWRGSRRGRVP
jgi:Ca-activated chloride channel family protein